MELVYVLCQLASADICEEHRAPVYADAPFACLMGALAELPGLTPEGWRVSRWRCESDRVDRVAMEGAAKPGAVAQAGQR